MKFPHFIMALLIILSLFLISCTSDSTSGGGSGTDIVCQVFDSDYYEVKGAKVIIKPKDYIPGLDNSNITSPFSGTTDNEGTFIIDKLTLENLSDSNYTITVIHSNNTGSIRTVNFYNDRDFDYIDDTKKILRYFVLEPNGNASGHVVNGPENQVTNRALVCIPGTEFVDTTDSNGKYFLDSIPKGFNSLSYFDLDTTSKFVELENIEIQSGDLTILDTISLNEVVLLQLQNNFPKRLDTLYTLNNPKQNSYLSMGGNVSIATPRLFNNFQFTNWELIYGKTTILADSLDSTTLTVTTNSIVRANYKDIEGPDSIGNVNIDVKGNQVTFTWSPTSDNDTVKEYMIIYRYQSDSSIIDTFTYTDTTAYFEGLSYENTTYSCTLKACDPSGNFSASKILTFKTDKNDNTPPLFNSEIVIQKLNATYASIFWSPAVDGLGIRKYEILIDDIYQTFRTECFYSGEELTPGDTINVKVRAYDYYDNISSWIEKDVIMPLINDTIAPTVPIIDSSSVNGQEAYFSWKPSTDNVSDTVTYEIKYSDQSSISESPVFINIKNATEFKLTGLKTNTNYELSIRAFDLAWYYSDASTILITTE